MAHGMGSDIRRWATQKRDRPLASAGSAARVLGNGHAGDISAGIGGRAFENHVRRQDDGRSRVPHGDSLNAGAAVATIVRGGPSAVNHTYSGTRKDWRLRRQRTERRL